jgi:hypothetical protein
MHVEHPNAKVCRSPAGACNGIWNIVKLQIEEYIEALPLHRLDKARARRGKELLSNLNAASRWVQSTDEFQRRGGVGEVERDDHARLVHAALIRSSLRSGE